MGQKAGRLIIRLLQGRRMEAACREHRWPLRSQTGKAEGSGGDALSRPPDPQREGTVWSVCSTEKNQDAWAHGMGKLTLIYSREEYLGSTPCPLQTQAQAHLPGAPSMGFLLGQEDQPGDCRKDTHSQDRHLAHQQKSG